MLRFILCKNQLIILVQAQKVDLSGREAETLNLNIP